MLGQGVEGLAGALLGKSGTGPSVYTGQLANNTITMNDKLSFGASSQMESGSFHIARSKITAMSVAVPTWWVVHGTGLESGIGGTATVNLNIEYPVGTVAGTFAWSGQTTATLPDNSNNLSDLLTGLNIPKGATFGLHLFWQSANGFVLRNGNDVSSPVIYNQSRDAVHGEKYRQAASGLTMAATISAIPSSDANVGQVGWRPVAIVGPTVEPSVFLLGDSRSEGFHDQYDDGSFDIGYARAFGTNFGIINASKFARTTGQYISSHARQNELAAFCSHIAFGLGFNDISSAGASLTTFYANQQTIMGYFPGTPFFCLTLPPGATSTDSFLTSGNQTQLTKVPNMQSYNAALRAGTIAGVTGYFDFARVADPADAGIWNPASNPISAVYTAAQATSVITVASVTSGAIALFDMVNNVGALLPAAQIPTFGTGAGGTGTYNSSKSGTVGSQTFFSNAPTTDGVHEFSKMNGLYRSAGVVPPAVIHR